MATFRDKYKLEVETQQAQSALNGLKKVVGAVAAAFAVKEIVQFTQDSLALVDAQAKTARSLAATADGVRAVKIAASDAGLENLEGGLNRLNRRLGAAAQGNQEYARTVEELGLDLTELAAQDADERIASIADAVKESGKNSQETARLIQNLGFEQANANAFFRQGGDAIRNARQEVEDYGLSLNAVDSAKVEAANDAFSRVGRSIEVVQQRLAVGLAPLLEVLSTMFNDLVKDNNGFRDSVDGMVQGAISGFGFIADAIAGIKRTFQIAGKAVALFGLGATDVMLTVANAIVNKPIQAINELIAAMNELPGVNITPVGLTEFGQTIQNELKTVRAAQEVAIKDMKDLLLEPMPSSVFEERYKEIQARAEETARKQKEEADKARKSLTEGPGGANFREIEAAQKAVEDSVKASQKRIADSQRELTLAGFDGLERNLKEIELKEKELARVAKERIREQFGENANPAELNAALDKVEQSRLEATRKQQEAARKLNAIKTQNARQEEQREAAQEAREQRLADIEEQRQRQFSVGWQNAFDDYADNATNAAQTAQQLFEQSTQGMEDAIVGFVKTGKFEFKDLIATMLETLLRSQIQQMMASLMGGTGFSAGGGSSIINGISKFAGLFADGGRIPSGQFGIVGEKGPEFISGPANITPMSEGIGSSSTNVTYNINAVDAKSFKELVARDPAFIHQVGEQGRKRTPQTRR